MSSESFWNPWWIPLVNVSVILGIVIFVWLIWWLLGISCDQCKASNIPSRNNSEHCITQVPNEATGTRPLPLTFLKANGLRNLRNTCYFNAAIQCLCQTTILARKLYIDESLNKGNLIKQFIKLLNEMHHASTSPVNPDDLHKEFCLRVPKFYDFQQHDSHEFLRNFLDELRKDERENTAYEPNLSRTMKAIDRVFGGHYITVYICDRCKAPYHICEPILDMSLPIRIGKAEVLTETTPAHNCTETVSLITDDPYRKAVKLMMTPLSEVKLKPTPVPNPIETTLAGNRTINDCLGLFTRVEHIKDEYLCNKCCVKQEENGNQELTSATKQTLILNPPAILTIHLKRFELAPGQSRKVNDMVDFDELLDIGPYCSSWCLRNDPPRKNLWYSLYGVIVHQSGFLTTGHYIAYVKVREEEEQGFEKFLQDQYFDRDITAEQLVGMMEKFRQRPTENWQGINTKGDWYLVNDSHVSKVTSETVLQERAYLLFYERLVHV